MSLLPPPGILPNSAPQTFNAGLTLGAIEIGVLVSTFLFGLVTVQSYIYIYRFPKDPILIKCLVPFVWALEFAHTICICQALYEVTVTQYGRPELLDIPPQSLNVAVLFSGFIGPIEQGWFAHRIYKFSGKIYLPLFCSMLAIVRWIGSVTIAIVAFHRLTVEVYYENWSWLLTTILVIGAFTDVILAVALCYYLSQWRGGGFERTTRLIDHLMVWSIETGLLTSVGAVALLVCFLTLRNTFVWIGIFSVLARLFSNSFLASLNARPALAQLYQEDMYPVLELSGVMAPRPASLLGKTPLLPPHTNYGQAVNYDVEKGRPPDVVEAQYH
ncbi:hypothetical protein B0H34DRAFT_8039 [Crassisporium funariophilum]|nr:hypothetical protein B0H34DRAFT_8039 [Crassisporium funariophilum]